MPALSRRSLIVALIGGSFAAGTARQALAFSEQKGTESLQALRDNACGASSKHQQLVEEVEQVLGNQYSPEEKKAVVANLTCPVCGCPLAGLF